MKKLFEAGENVKIKETNEIVTIKKWWTVWNKPSLGVLYQVNEYPSAIFYESQFGKLN